MKRLILVEGLPGTGKTTTSGWLADLLTERGEPVLLLNEGDERIPCDFYQTAGIPENEFELLCLANPSYCELLAKAATRIDSYYFIRIDQCPVHIAEKIKRWDMGDEANSAITVADYIPCALARLRSWVDANIDSADTVIIDSGYLQNPINELLFRHASDEEVTAFVSAITVMLRPLNPVCIYLRRESADAAVAFAKGAKGQGWAERVDDMLRQSGCGNLFEHRFELELELLQNIESLICHVCDDSWQDARQTIRSYFAV